MISNNEEIMLNKPFICAKYSIYLSIYLSINILSIFRSFLGYLQ